MDIFDTSLFMKVRGQKETVMTEWFLSWKQPQVMANPEHFSSCDTIWRFHFQCKAFTFYSSGLLYIVPLKKKKQKNPNRSSVKNLVMSSVK